MSKLMIVPATAMSAGAWLVLSLALFTSSAGDTAKNITAGLALVVTILFIGLAFLADRQTSKEVK